MEPAECSPAAWQGNELAVPVPIHRILDLPSFDSLFFSISATTFSTQFDQSQFKNYRYILPFSPYYSRSKLVRCFFNYFLKSISWNLGNETTLIPYFAETMMASLLNLVTLTTTCKPFDARFINPRWVRLSKNRSYPGSFFRMSSMVAPKSLFDLCRQRKCDCCVPISIICGRGAEVSALMASYLMPSS